MSSLRLPQATPPFGPLKQDFPEAEQVVWTLENTDLLPYGEHAFNEPRMFYAEPALFKVLSFDMVSGNPDQALANPFSVMLFRPMAKKYFGSANLNRTDGPAGLPIAWYAMHNWLNGFAYRTDMHRWMFLLAGGLTVHIALLTVSFQSVKAALMNPAKSLRSE